MGAQDAGAARFRVRVIGASIASPCSLARWNEKEPWKQVYCATTHYDWYHQSEKDRRRMRESEGVPVSISCAWLGLKVGAAGACKGKEELLGQDQPTSCWAEEKVDSRSRRIKKETEKPRRSTWGFKTIATIRVSAEVPKQEQQDETATRIIEVIKLNYSDWSVGDLTDSGAVSHQTEDVVDWDAGVQSARLHMVMLKRYKVVSPLHVLKTDEAVSFVLNLVFSDDFVVGSQQFADLCFFAFCTEWTVLHTLNIGANLVECTHVSCMKFANICLSHSKDFQRSIKVVHISVDSWCADSFVHKSQAVVGCAQSSEWLHMTAQTLKRKCCSTIHTCKAVSLKMGFLPRFFNNPLDFIAYQFCSLFNRVSRVDHIDQSMDRASVGLVFYSWTDLVVVFGAKCFVVGHWHVCNKDDGSSDQIVSQR